ncbi:FIG00554584: hypothetical protein [Cronobacter malonaticus 507]|nr:FIG00554584: hypothetical protein [Cronobacter malonaticus 507]
MNSGGVMTPALFRINTMMKAHNITPSEGRKVYHRITNMEHKHGVESAR